MPASDSIIKTEPLPAVRGQRRDRKGKVLATVRPSYNVYVTARTVTGDSFSRLRALLGMNGDQAIDVWEKIQTTPRDAKGGERPLLVAEDISREACARCFSAPLAREYGWSMARTAWQKK